MTAVGDVVIPTLLVTPFDDDTEATLIVVAPDTDPDDEPEPEDAVTSDEGHTWTCEPITYTVAGIWRLNWTITGTGAGRSTQVVAVARDAALTVTGRTYATSTDLANHTGTAPDVGAERSLIAATREIDRLLLCAVYETDDDGMPTDADVIEALRDATCELVSWWAETGNESGYRALVTSASIGPVSLSYGTASGKPQQAARVGEKVSVILANAGLTGQAPAMAG